MSYFSQARALIWEFKGGAYAFGTGSLRQTGPMAAELGCTGALIVPSHPGADEVVGQVRESLQLAGVTIDTELAGAAPNAPREDVQRLAGELKRLDPDLLVVIGGGSNIDATKAGNVMATLGGPIDRYFGTGLVSSGMDSSGKRLNPLVAVQTASSSAAHLTKYSNITDIETGQKKLIVDEAIVPPKAVFQYDVTTTMSPAFTADGALDGLSHMIEVLYGAVGQGFYDKAEQIAAVGVSLIVHNLEHAVGEPENLKAREALGLATDLGGYAIMVGGTNGGHLTSFSLVDILSHGRACAITNPYYTVFFAPAIEGPLRLLGQIYKDAGFIQADIDGLRGRQLGIAVAEAMIDLQRRIGFPATLGEVEGFSEAHIGRALDAAKNPQLKMKLQNMPVPLTAEMVDDYMGPILDAARVGDLDRIKNVP
jgi:alcohol dehydrogenase class IV